MPAHGGLRARSRPSAGAGAQRGGTPQGRALAQRVQADFVNYRRRVEEEQQEFQRGAAAQLILKLLPVLDDLERALVQTTEDASPSNEGWLEGIRLVVRKFHAVMEEAGVQRVEAAGRPFDPWEHEAVAFQETEEHPAGHVLGLVREGYKLHGRVRRAAQVVVARAPQGDSSPGPPAQTDSDS